MKLTFPLKKKSYINPDLMPKNELKMNKDGKLKISKKNKKRD